jgi:hypothetical protein
MYINGLVRLRVERPHSRRSQKAAKVLIIMDKTMSGPMIDNQLLGSRMARAARAEPEGGVASCWPSARGCPPEIEQSFLIQGAIHHGKAGSGCSPLRASIAEYAAAVWGKGCGSPIFNGLCSTIAHRSLKRGGGNGQMRMEFNP